MQTKAARTRWAIVEAHLGPQPDLFAELAARYAEPWRAYHDLGHVLDVLSVLDDVALTDPLAVTLAVWFHDAVYDPRANDNEERSAALAAERSANLLGGDWVRRVETLILATKRHEPTGDPDTAALLDADLAILGASPARYDAYAAAIRREYAWVPDDAYREGRSRVLHGFLGRDRVYRTPRLFARFEAAARRNLRRELGFLADA